MKAKGKKKAAADKPSTSDFFAKAIEAQSKGDFENAERYYLKAIELNPKDSIAHKYLGDFYANLQDYEQAKSYYFKALALNPDYLEAHINLGSLYSVLHDYDQAITQLLKAFDISPNDASVHYNLGILMLQTGKVEKGIILFQLAARLGLSRAQSWLKENGYDW
jgi:tetratricopeptide (TPR) repeat protein